MSSVRLFTLVTLVAITGVLAPLEVQAFGFSSLMSIAGNYNPISYISGLVTGNNISDDMTIIPTRHNIRTPTIDQAKRYAHFAAAAYCNDPDLSEWTCEDCVATGPSAHFYKELNNDTENTRGYVTIDEDEKQIVLSFRGTINLHNVLQDMRVEMTPVAGGNGKIQVHQGAWDDLMSLKDQVEDTVRTLHEKHPDFGLVITGHSLGGMLASLAFFHLKTTPEFADFSYSLFTYGQPRTGNIDFAEWVNLQPVVVARVVSNSDIIPHSTLSSAGFMHHLRELWIHDDKEEFCSVEMFEDPECSNSLGPAYGITDHLFYWDCVFPPTDCLWSHPWSYVQHMFKKSIIVDY